jgi:LPXTG-motif cell wall-anchored protein
MTTREYKTIFHYLLDKITRRSLATVDDTLPQDIQEDLAFSLWLHDVDFSEESQIQNSLRRKIEKQAELLQSASRMKHLERNPAPIKRGLSLPALIGILVGGASMLIAALLVIFRKRKNEVSSKTSL